MTCFQEVQNPHSALGIDQRFAGFVCANTPKLVRAAYLLTASTASAEDLVQDTFVRLYRQWAKVEAADVPMAYVRRSMTNLFLNQRRRPVTREIATDIVVDRPAERSDVDDLVDRDQMWAMLQTLGARQRTALVLRYYEGLDDGEIGEILGCRPGTVRSLLSRGLAALRASASAAA